MTKAPSEINTDAAKARGKHLFAISAVATSLSMAAGVAVIVASIAGVLASGLERGEEVPRRMEVQFDKDIRRLDAILSMLETKVVVVEGKLDALAAADDSTDPGRQINAVRSEVVVVADRLGRLEAGLLTDAEKALSLPLLRVDLENLKEIYRSDLDSAVKSVDRIYDLNKWFIGLMFTMAVGLIGLAISNFFQIRRKSE